MAIANGTPSILAVAGMLCGMLLLGFAGTMVLIPHEAMTAEVVGAVRRLQGAVTVSNPQLGVVVPTTTYPSSFDSSDSSSSGSSFEPSKSSESDSFKRSGSTFEEGGATWAAGGGTTTTQLLIMLCFACLYNRNAVEPILQKAGTLEMRMRNMPSPDTDDFDNTICECLNDKWVCIHGLCCPLVRMAHTNAVAGILGFWETALCWCCCSFWSVGLGPCCLMIWFRMRLKQIMKIEDHACNDFCVTLFCPLLSVCQQGTAVDTAMGYEVVGCCDLEWTEGGDKYSY